MTISAPSMNRPAFSAVTVDLTNFSATSAISGNASSATT
jgi:hypothetical protein